MRKLDLIDRKILLELDTNARASFSQIGKKLRIGKNNVQYRVKRLLEDGVIKKFVTQFSLGILGLFLGKIFLQLFKRGLAYNPPPAHNPPHPRQQLRGNVLAYMPCFLLYL